jgi:hypothetical protein
MKRKRWNIPLILKDPVLRRELMVRSIMFTQAVENINTTREQAEHAYDKVMKERKVWRKRMSTSSRNSS